MTSCRAPSWRLLVAALAVVAAAGPETEQTCPAGSACVREAEPAKRFVGDTDRGGAKLARWATQLRTQAQEQEQPDDAALLQSQSPARAAAAKSPAAAKDAAVFNASGTAGGKRGSLGREQCMCPVDHPYCWPHDGYCYLSESSPFWSGSQCAGTCTASYSKNLPTPSGQCVYYTFQAKDAKSSMILGTKSNMHIPDSLGLDLGGLWWMWGNPVPEVLASFAGARVTSDSYPTTLKVSNSLSHHWSWKSDAFGTALMKFYSLSSPEATMDFNMASSTSGDIETSLKENPAVLVEKWGFYYVNKDMWLRTTTFQGSSPLKSFPGDTDYNLTRIINEDGTYTQYWDDFLASSDSGEHQTFATDDSCVRQCRIAVWSCTACKASCGIFR